MIFSRLTQSLSGNDKTTMQPTGNFSFPRVGLQFADSAFRTHYISKGLREVGLAGRKVDSL